MLALVCGANTEYGSEITLYLQNEGYRVITCQNSFVDPKIADTVKCDFTDESSIATAVADFVNQDLKFDLVVWADRLKEDNPFSVAQSFDFKNHYMFNALSPFILTRYLTRFDVCNPDLRLLVVFNEEEADATNLPSYLSDLSLQALARSAPTFMQDVTVVGIKPVELNHLRFVSRFRDQLSRSLESALTGQVIY